MERRIGRGRMVATAFALSARKVVNWQNFDGFLNGCLMRRPSREFSTADSGFPQVKTLRTPLEKEDARVTCGLRYFSRDARIPGEGRNTTQPLTLNNGEDDLWVQGRPIPLGAPEDAVPPESTEASDSWGLGSVGTRDDTGVSAVDGYLNDPQRGVAGWSDFTAAANEARSALQRAAGISIPERGICGPRAGGVSLVPGAT